MINAAQQWGDGEHVPKSRVLDLAPAYWKKTLQNEKTQQRLADNPFRSAVMALNRLHPDDT